MIVSISRMSAAERARRWSVTRVDADARNRSSRALGLARNAESNALIFPWRGADVLWFHARLPRRVSALR